MKVLNFQKKPNFKGSKCNLFIEKIEKENRDKAQNEKKKKKKRKEINNQIIHIYGLKHVAL